MISYNDLYEALRKEKYSEQLQPLQKGFIQEVSGYLKDKEKISKKDGDLFSENVKKTKKQLENAISIFKELILRRKKKLLDLAFVSVETGISKRDFDNMMAFEKEVFDKILKALNEGDKEVERLLGGKEEDSVEKNKLVVFKN
jgi:DNA replication initiation complex subunit (GINS family)